MKAEKTYVVEVPYRGVQTYLVKARSAAEAMRKAEDGEDESKGVEPLDFRVTETYRPRHAQLDGGQP